MKQFNKIDTSSKSLKTKAYEKIHDDIKTCVLYPGERLGINDLSERYEIGITPVREALQQLISDGFVISVPRYGYVVTPITVNDINDLFEVRLILEKASVELAIQRASEDQVKEIMNASDFSYEYRDRKSYSAFLRKNFIFHSTISKVCGNSRLDEMLRNVNIQLDRVFYLGLDIKDSTAEMREEHIALAEAIAKRNLILAEKSINSQILSSRERVIQALSYATNLNF